MKRAMQVLSVLFLCLFGATQRSLAQASAKSRNARQPSRIHSLYLADQSENPGNTSEAEQYKHGDVRRAEIRAMLDKGEVKNPQDFYDAALIFLHGRDANDFLVAHLLAVEAIIRGDNSAKWMAAATLDRYLLKAGREQVFGTQYPADPNAAKEPLKPLVDPHVVNLTRTQAPFDQQLVPASVRKDFCVPDLMQQQKILATLNTGHYPTKMSAEGCTR